MKKLTLAQKIAEIETAAEKNYNSFVNYKDSDHKELRDAAAFHLAKYSTYNAILQLLSDKTKTIV